MYVKEGNSAERVILDDLSSYYDKATFIRKKTRGIDIKMNIWSRNLNIEVKSCQLRTSQSKTEWRYYYSKFILPIDTLSKNDIIIFIIRDTLTIRVFPTSYINMMFSERIVKYIENESKYFYITIKELLSLKYFTMDYILKHYCNQLDCSFNCELCPYTNINTKNHFKQLYENVD